MTVKDFFATLRRTGEPHIVVDTDGEPTVVVLPYERYRLLVEKDGWRTRRDESTLQQHDESRKTVFLPLDSTIPKPEVLDDTEEPHFQFEPLPEDEDLTHG